MNTRNNSRMWQLPAVLALTAAFSLGLTTANSAPTHEDILVSAAASLKDAFQRIGHDYEKRHPDVTVHFNFGASGTLQHQIEQGAQADLFVSAAERNMDALVAKDLIVKQTRHVLVTNRLVLVVPTDSKIAIHGFRDLSRPDVRRVAIGIPKAVPAGQYAQEVLTKLGIWNAVSAKAVEARDVREVLTQVELGNVDAGIVYQSDAASSRRVRVVAAADESWHSPIRYPVAVVAATKHPEAARGFEAWLLGPESATVLRQCKFVVPTRK